MTRPRDPRHRFGPVVLGTIAAGGALGTLVRHGLAQLAPTSSGGFPWVTLVVNASGSLALGAVLVHLSRRFPPPRYLRLLVATGFMGAYTTYSTFAVETVTLARDGHSITAATYLASGLVTGLGAAWVGTATARRLHR